MIAKQVQEKWELIRDKLLAEIASCNEVTCQIPDWDPVDLDVGLHWLQSSVYEGYYVDYKVYKENDSATVWFKVWEYGDEEPTWPEIIQQ